jgi:hypothetical protein
LKQSFARVYDARCREDAGSANSWDRSHGSDAKAPAPRGASTAPERTCRHAAGPALDLRLPAALALARPHAHHRPLLLFLQPPLLLLQLLEALHLALLLAASDG